jgi:glucokinase
MLLAGDIGGTKTSLAVYSSESGPRAPLSEATFPSAEYPSVQSLVRVFLSQVDLPIERAVFGVAGPVVGGRAEITNLSWVISESELQAALDLSSVTLLNDLQAIANGVPFLESQGLYTLHAGQTVSGGTVAVIAPGTGLGEAFLTWDGIRYRAHATEGGHVDFAPADELQDGLLRYLRERFGHVSYERVCSGMGLPNIYDYLRDSGHAPEPAWLAEALQGTEDRTPVIVEAALSIERSSMLCSATLDMFVDILGAESGNLALKVLATGGIYVGGGIPPRILKALQQGRFLEALQAKGRFSELLSRIPVRVILNPKVALLGAACYGLGLWSREAASDVAVPADKAGQEAMA